MIPTMRMTQCQLHFIVMAVAAMLFTSHAQTNTELFSSSNYTTTSLLGNNDFTTSIPVKLQETLPITTKDQRSSTKEVISSKTHTLSNDMFSCSTDKYKQGIMICIIIIAVLVLICAILIICLVILANKVARLKNKLATSKRQARSNGDFLSASSILWPTTMDTWQKKTQAANHSMDEISLGDTNNAEEKHQLMQSSKVDDSKYFTEGKISTLEKDHKNPANIIVEI
ncbi:protein EVI2A [Pelobates fuscus]|uniref:protein EVI2A n=1 Tax=Pelobates fuscus TaxID=191477 RepID=UPI002FE45A92